MNTKLGFGARGIHGIALIVADLEAATAFYCNGLGFTFEAQPGATGANSASAMLNLGGITLRLEQPASPGVPYPAERAANDPWFQHFAIRVADMNAAYDRLSGQPFNAISVGGPQQLPANSGSVIAFKFRDPDGHPLELSHYPGELHATKSSPFLGIDHSAVAVSDIDASIKFYGEQLGFRMADRLVNQGPTQWRLDGLGGVVVDIAVLKPPGPGPHLELLHYRSPSRRAPRSGTAMNDIVATRLLVTAEVGGILTDPDGHLIELVQTR